MRPPIDLDTFRQAIADADAIPVTAGGRTFVIRPPQLLSDDEYTALMASDDADLSAQARILVDDYDGFCAAGGSALIVMQIVRDAAARKAAEQGADAGESGASSDS